MTILSLPPRGDEPETVTVFQGATLIYQGPPFGAATFDPLGRLWPDGDEHEYTLDDGEPVR